MKKNELISVVLPAFNAEKTICLAIDSVLKQTHQNIELIICDDCSTDKTKNIINTYLDSRIKLLSNKKNLGEGPSRDKAISFSKGKWIAVIDADDAWHPQRLEKLVFYAKYDYLVFDNLHQCLSKKNHDLVLFSSLRSLFSFGKINFKPSQIPLELFIKEKRLLIKPIFSRDFVMKNSITHSDKKFSADTYFFLSMIKNGAKLFYVPKKLYFYRLTIGAASLNPKRFSMMQETIEICMDNWALGTKEKIAFNEKLENLRREESYYNFITSIKENRHAHALKMALKNPSFFILFLRRSLPQAYKIIFLKTFGATSR